MTVYVDGILKQYWLRLPDETREAIEQAVPPTMHIRIYAGHPAQPGTGTVGLRTADNHSVAETRGRDLARMCWAVLRAPVLRVTTDAAGWVTDIEEVSA